MEAFREEEVIQSSLQLRVGTRLPHGFCLLFGSPQASEEMKCRTCIRGRI